MIAKLLNPGLWKSTITFSVTWIIFYFALTYIQGNGSFVFDMDSVLIIFILAFISNFVLSFVYPGRYR